jgi:hypothetical protein
MKRTFLLFFFALFILTAHSQIKAVTESGDTVILNSNGQWAYPQDSSANNENDTIAINNTIYVKDKQATILRKCRNGNFGIYYDQTKWGIQISGINQTQECSFISKDKSLNAEVVSESITIDVDNLPKIIEINALKIAADFKIIKKDYRTVNGLKIICLQATATVQGLKAYYLYYLYSNDVGTIQFLAYTIGKKKFDSNYKTMETLLNGLTVIK